ncbi:MAG: hypothetical protein QHH02_00930 [Syntrophomonadaceae bacterium]|nr:hypothetical protein [Syntrophomonadaceae bacterium]
MEIKTYFTAGRVYEVKRFNYDLGGQVMAELEVYLYGESTYGCQARMLLSGEVIRVREIYPTLDMAVERLSAEVEKRLVRDFELDEKAS